MERAEDKVAGERGADGDFGGFEVAHFADHDDIRVAAQDAAEGGGEGQVDFRLHGDLDDAVELVFDRVLDGDDAALLDVERAEECVERGALAAAGGAGDEHDAVRQREECADFFLVLGVEPEAGEVEALLAKEAKADIFAVNARDGGDADIDRLACDFEGDAAILRAAALGDVERGHDFQAGDDGILEELDALGHGGLVEHAVDAVADAEVLAERLEMDVGGALLEALAEDLVHELHHRGLGIVLVHDVHLLLRAAGDVVLAALEQFLEGLRADAVGFFEGFEQAAAGGHDRADGALPMLGDGGEARVVEGVEAQELQFAAIDLRLGEHDLAEGEAGGEFFADILDGGHIVFLAPGEVEAGGEGFQEILLADELGIEDRGDRRALGEGCALEDFPALFGLAATGAGGQLQEVLSQIDHWTRASGIFSSFRGEEVWESTQREGGAVLQSVRSFPYRRAREGSGLPRKR